MRALIVLGVLAIELANNSIVESHGFLGDMHRLARWPLPQLDDQHRRPTFINNNTIQRPLPGHGVYYIADIMIEILGQFVNNEESASSLRRINLNEDRSSMLLATHICTLLQSLWALPGVVAVKEGDPHILLEGRQLNNTFAIRADCDFRSAIDGFIFTVIPAYKFDGRTYFFLASRDGYLLDMICTIENENDRVLLYNNDVYNIWKGGNFKYSIRNYLIRKKNLLGDPFLRLRSAQSGVHRHFDGIRGYILES